MKKTLSLILALLMSLSTAAVAFAEETIPAEPETDVENEVEETVEVSPYDEALTYLNQYEIMKGDENGDLKADADVTRTHMALFVSRISTGWTADSKWAQFGTDNYTPYTDLAGSYAEKVIGALTYADENGIIKGVGDNRFAPEANVTYQDALTMAVRTLGYTNLSYPWGFITKAIELGLTENIEEAVFTETISRGVAAQIIYNALMAETKAGGTLALKNFGTEFGWEDVVIVASAKDVLLTNDKAKAGFIGFQLVKDGALDETIYYADAADFDLDVTKYEDITAVGSSYRVFFEMNEEGLTNTVECFKVVPNHVETLWNAEGELGIKAALDAKEYTLLNKYSETANWKPTAAVNELIVVDALGGIKHLVDSKKNIGIDFATDDIVVYETKTAKDDAGEEYKYAEIVETLWWYNDINDAYYRVIYKADKNEIGIEYMDAKEEAELRDLIGSIKFTEEETFDKGFATIVAPDKVKKATAYASLDVYEVEGKYYGIFEEFKFGKFANVNYKVCDHNNTVDGYAISNVWNIADATAVEVTLPETIKGAIALKKNDGCDTCKKHVTTWINPDFAANYDAETEEYLDGYVIYSADVKTGEIKIVKYIGEKGTEYATEDDYVTYGTVRAYDVKKETVVINGTEYTFNYDNLAGTELVNVNKDGKVKFMEQYSDNLRLWLNQYVEIVVLDGEIVHMAVVDVKNTEEYFIVERYAGISSDGYIVVDGYKVNADGVETLAQARIATINNAYTGDLFYYLTEEKIENYFDKGVVYVVSSINEDGALNAQIVWEDGEISDWVKDEKEGFRVANVGGIDERNKVYYGQKNDKGEYPKETNSVRTYVLISDVNNDDKVEVVVYTGKVDEGWDVTGTKLEIADVTVLVDVTYNAANSFNKASTASGLVALVDNHYWVADFDGAVNNEPWYLLGAANYVIRVFDFAKCEYVEVNARNVDLKEGYIYGLTGGTLIYDDKTDAGSYTTKTVDGKEVVDTIYETISAQLDAALVNCVIDDIELTTIYNDKGELTGFTKDTLEATIVAEVYDDMGYTKAWDDIVEVKDVALITLDVNTKKRDVIITDIEDDFDKADLAKLDEKADTVTVDGFYVVDLETGAAYVYAFKNTVSKTASEKWDGKTATPSDVIIITEAYEDGKKYDAYIDASAVIDNVKKVDGKVTEGTINSVTIFFAGDKVLNSNHATIKDQTKPLYFDVLDTCDKNSWSCTVDGKPVYDKKVSVTTYADQHEEDVCELINAITVDFADVKFTDDETTFINVNLTNSAGTKLNINLKVEVKDGKVVFGIYDMGAKDSYFGSYTVAMYAKDNK